MLTGWQELTSDLLEAHRTPLSPEDLKRYFDGQEPEWRHALAPPEQIPRRPVAVDGRAQLRAPAAGTAVLVLLVGADGQGKSTALRQMAADLVADRRRLLFRDAGAPLDPAAVAGLPRAADGSGWILASDHADEIARDVETAIEQLVAAGRHDVHWLLSARDVDWKAQFVRQGRSLEPSWERTVALWPTLSNRVATLAVTAATTKASAGLGAWAASGTLGAIADAPSILAAWAEAGCLGAAVALPDGERGVALEARATKTQGLSDATLLGGGLDLRYGAEGLPALVEDLVMRLDGPGLRDAFLFAAAAQVAGVDGIDLNVAADLISVDRDDRYRAILAPLAAAGLAGGSGGALRPRHRALAAAAVKLVGAGRLPGDLEDLYRRLVRGTATTGNDVKALVAGGAIMNCGPLLSEKLQQLGLGPPVADQVACAVADEAEARLSDFLLFSVTRARTYQAAQRGVEARRLLRARIADATSKHDWDTVGRSFLHELSGPEASAGALAEGATLAGLALADAVDLGQVLMADAKMALLALGAACTEMAAHEDGSATTVSPKSAVFRRQLRACAHLGEKVTPKWDQRARFDFHALKARADEYQIPPTSAAEALLWLGETVQTVMAMVDDDDVWDLAWRIVPTDAPLRFAHLEYTIGLGRLPWAKE